MKKLKTNQLYYRNPDTGQFVPIGAIGGGGGEITDEKISNAVNSWLDEHPEATTTVQDGTITEAKLADDVKAKLGSGGTITDKPYHLQNIGTLYDNPEGYAYLAWCPGNLRYDSSINKYVVLVWATEYHLATTDTLFATYINPDTFEAEELTEVIYYDTDGTTVYQPKYNATPSFIILKDGTYLMIHSGTTADSTTSYRFISYDRGKTWVKKEQVTGFNDIPWNIFELSNGRLIASEDARKKGLYYSDDKGISWTNVIPDTSGGDYEAEACILELQEGKLIAIARYSMSGIGYNASGASEPAIVSYSEDYGTTWTAWEKSETITNMNASSCTGYVHNGMVDIFACSRWYWHGDYANDDYLNTGKTGAITHYTATVENALLDNFTSAGIVTYANAVGDTSSQDFHSPTMAVNGDDMLLMWFDRIPPYTEEVTSHYFARGSKADLDTAPRDDLSSVVFPYSSAMVDKLLKQQYTKLMTKINEIIIAGGGTPDEGDPENPTLYAFDGIVANFNYLDVSKHDTTNMTITDTINNIVGTFKTKERAGVTVTEFPTIRKNSAEPSHLYIPSDTLSWFITDDPYELSIELSVFPQSDDEFNYRSTPGIFYSDGNGGGSLRIISDGVVLWYLDTSGNQTNTRGTASGTQAVFYDAPTDHLSHEVVTFAADGTIRVYKNGVYIGGYDTPATFAKLADVNLTRGFSLNGAFKSARIYNRVLTDAEVLNNYNYELQSII